MWVASFGSHEFWLPPGTHTVGRSKENDIRLIASESMSRRHLEIKVEVPQPETVSHPTIRSRLIIRAMKKAWVDDSPLEPGEFFTVPCRKPLILVRMSTHILSIRWVDYTITYSTGSTGSEHDALWEAAVKILAPFDLKLVPDILDSTKIVMVTARRTSKLYYALASQLPIVTNQYLDILRSCFSTVAPGPPDPAPFLPDPEFSPNPNRSICLASQKFQCIDKEVYESLRPVIEAAGGTCVLSDSEPADLHTMVIRPIRQILQFRARIIDRDRVFAAILGARPVAEVDVHEPQNIIPRLQAIDFLNYLVAPVSPTRSSDTAELASAPVPHPPNPLVTTAESADPTYLPKPEDCAKRSDPAESTLILDVEPGSRIANRPLRQKRRVGKLLDFSATSTPTKRQRLAHADDTSKSGGETPHPASAPADELPAPAVKILSGATKVADQRKIGTAKPNISRRLTSKTAQAPSGNSAEEVVSSAARKSKPPAKRRRIQLAPPVPDFARISETESESDVEFEALGELAIVEYDASLGEPLALGSQDQAGALLSAPSNDQQSKQRNFKRFHKKGTKFHSGPQHADSQDLFVSDLSTLSRQNEEITMVFDSDSISHDPLLKGASTSNIPTSEMVETGKTDGRDESEDEFALLLPL